MIVSGFSQSSGELTVYPNHFYHSPQNYGEIKNLTVKWSFRTLFGEPVIDGVFKWEAGSNTPVDFLDYRDYVLLKCAPIKMSVANGHILSFYIAITPTVPRAGEGYGFNTPGSPAWNDVFINSLWDKRQGENKYRLDINYLPYKTVGDYAKAIWKGGFKVIDAELVRAGGLDADKTIKSNTSSNDDFWNTPENTTTQNDLKQKEAIDRQKQLTQQAKNKYNALKKPFTLNVTNRDTVSEASLQVLKAINPYFQNSLLTLSSVSNGKVISIVNAVNANLQLTEGWNTLRIAIKGDSYNLKDSVRVYYKKDGRFGRMTDQQGNVYKTVKIGNQVWMAENLRFKASSGCWAYDNDESNVKIYGYLYDWNTAISVCPPGWHLPSKAEWVSLIETLGGKEIAKTSMKSATGWNENGNNSSGFCALSGGCYSHYYDNTVEYKYIGSYASWWCSGSSNTYGDCISLSMKWSFGAWEKQGGLSVRYIKN